MSGKTLEVREEGGGVDRNKVAVCCGKVSSSVAPSVMAGSCRGRAKTMAGIRSLLMVLSRSWRACSAMAFVAASSFFSSI